jgi:ABC-2 type transport system ATP-binding protein
MRLPRLRRPRRRRTVVAMIAAAVVVLTLALLIVLTRPPGVRTESRFIPGTPEADGRSVQLDTTLYLPAATPAPAILLAHGFGGDKTDLATQAKDLAQAGYVVLAYSARGFGQSGGLVHLDAPAYEVADAAKLVDFLATQPSVRQDGAGDPRVGVAGSSYGGGLALLLAGTDRRIDAVGADITWNDLEHALFPNGVATGPGVFKKLWAGYLFQAAHGTGPSDPTCGRFAPNICAAYQRAAETGRPDAPVSALLRASSPSSVISRITAPTLLIQGEQDSLFPLTEADANARGIAANGTPVKVVWRSGGHDGRGQSDDVRTAFQNWFDVRLKGQGSTDTPFQFAVRGAGLSAASGRTISQTRQVDAGYPGVGDVPTRTRAINVQGLAQPISAPAGGNPAVVSVLPQLGNILDTAQAAGASNPLQGLAAIPGQVARFVSDPLPDRTLVAGASTVRLAITTRTTSDAVLFVGLRDVGSDGSDVLPSGLVTPVQLTGLTPGVAREVTITLPSVVRMIATGHRLVLTVATTDLAYRLPSDPRGYTVALAAGTTASLTLATVDGHTVRAGQPVLWLITGLAAVVLVAAAVGWWALRRRRASKPDPDLADVPIAIRDLVKEYGDGYRAVNGVTFQVDRGQVVGLLGPNGAGKTTTLRMLVGLIVPTRGEIHVFGQPIQPGAAVLSRIGSFIEGPGFLPHLSGRENLRLFWAASGRPLVDADFDTALQIAGLGASVDRKVKTYSHGMKQRLAIAQAMLGLPELLVLDEPTNGLDPPQIAEMREVLQRYAQTGRTVVISSHLLSEVEQTSTHVVVMHKGELIAAGSVHDIAGNGRMQLAVADPARATQVLAGAGITAETVPARRALEDVFLDLVGGE